MYCTFVLEVCIIIVQNNQHIGYKHFVIAVQFE